MPGTITTDQTLVNATGGDAEVLTNWTTTAAWSAAPAVSNDVFLQGSNAINARASSATPGTIALYWDHLTTGTANLDLTTTGQHVYFWIKCFCLPSMEKKVKGGIGISISSTAGVTKVGTDPWAGITDSKTWFVLGSDSDPLSGWVCYVVDPASTPDFSTGTPVMTSVDRIGIRAGALQTVGGGSVKPLPVLWDAVRYGTGLTIKDGTAGSPVTFNDIYAADSTTANQWGVITKNNGIYFVAGKLNFGTTGQANVTVFTDTNQVVVFQDFPVAAGFYDFVLNGAATKATTITFGSISGTLTSNGCVFRGAGLVTRRLIAPVIVSGGTGYTAGDILTVSGGTGTAATFKVITVSSGVITEIRMETAGVYSVPPTGTLSVTGGTGTTATFTATVAGGSIWTLTASAANQTLNMYACTLSEMKSAALASTSTLDGCTISNSGEVTANGGTIKNCTFQDMRTTIPISATYQIRVTTTTPVLTGNKFVNCAIAILWDRNADTNGQLDGCTFISGGTGYAIELGSNTPSSISLANVTFTGYGADGTANAAIYNNSGKSITITITGTGNSPTVNNGAGASTTVVAGAVSASVTTKTTAGVAIQNVRVLVLADTGGPFPSNATVTITRSVNTATVSHTAHAMATNDLVQITGANQSDYNGVFTITKIDANSYSYTVANSPATPATGTIKATFAVLSGLTDVNGLITMSRVFPSNQPITGRARKSTSSPYYKTSDIIGTVNSTAGMALTILMIADE